MVGTLFMDVLKVAQQAGQLSREVVYISPTSIYARAITAMFHHLHILHPHIRVCVAMRQKYLLALWDHFFSS